MVNGLIGKKIGMTQIFSESGDVVPVTVIEAGPCAVSMIQKNGDSPKVQLAFSEVRTSALSKAEVKHLEKNNIKPMRYLKEFKCIGDSPEMGKLLSPQDIFAISDVVKVTGISKGKGFQGVVKRHGHSGGPMAHGSRHHRLPGSIGACATPSRVFKGVKLPGRTGGEKKSVTNLKIVKIDEKQNLIFVSGSVPGPEESILTIEKMK